MKMKKFLSLLLALVMVLGLFPVSSLAIAGQTYTVSYTAVKQTDNGDKTETGILRREMLLPYAVYVSELIGGNPRNLSGETTSGSGVAVGTNTGVSFLSEGTATVVFRYQNPKYIDTYITPNVQRTLTQTWNFTVTRNPSVNVGSVVPLAHGALNVNGTDYTSENTPAAWTPLPGDTVTVTMTPDEHYRLKYDNLMTSDKTDPPDLTVEGNVYTFTMPDMDIYLDPVFELIPPNTVSCAPGEGGTVSAAESAYPGDTVTVEVTPDRGYALDSLTYTPDGGDAVEIPETDGVYSFTMPDGDVTVSAAFVRMQVLFVGDNDVTFIKGEAVEYTFTPEVTQGYRIYSVGSLDPECSLYDGETLLDYSDDADGLNFSVARILTAGKTYRLIFGCYSDGGTATVNVEPIELYPFRVDPALKENTYFYFDSSYIQVADRDLAAGTEIELSMRYIPDSNFDHWLITWPGEEAPEEIETFRYKFTMPAGPVYVSAVYTPPTELHMGENTVTLKQFNRTGYYFTPPESGWYRFKDLDERYDTMVTVYRDGNELIRSDYPYGGHTSSFDGVVELEAGVRYTVVMLSYNQTVEIPVLVKKADIFPINASVEGNGSLRFYSQVTGTTVSEENADTVIRVIADPNDGYMLEALSILDADGSEIPTRMAEDYNTFIMPDSAVSVTATFIPIDKTVTVDDESYYNFYCGVFNGGYWARRAGAHPGDTVLTYVKPSDKRAAVCQIIPATGEPFTIEGTYDYYYDEWHYSFVMPDCDVRVLFTQLDGHAVMIAPTEGGVVTADKMIAATDEIVTLTVTPEKGYIAGSVSVTHDINDVELTDLGNGQYSFKMPWRHVTVSAEFISCGHEGAQLTGWTWENGTATAAFTCEACGETITVTDEAPLMTEVTPATCTADQTATYAATVTFNGTEYTETSEVTAVPGTKTGHSYGDPVWTWSADYKTVTGTFTCTKGDDTKSVTQNATQVEISAATAKDDQVVKYTVAVEFGGKTYTTETENITVPGTATGEPDQPTNPDTPSQPSNPSGSGNCKWCGETHSGFWGSIVGFWHTIFYFWAHLFGLR